MAMFGKWLFHWLLVFQFGQTTKKSVWLLAVLLAEKLAFNQNEKVVWSSFLDWLLVCWPTNSIINSQQPQLILSNVFANNWVKQPTQKANTYRQCFQPVKQVN